MYLQRTTKTTTDEYETSTLLRLDVLISFTFLQYTTYISFTHKMSPAIFLYIGIRECVHVFIYASHLKARTKERYGSPLIYSGDTLHEDSPLSFLVTLLSLSPVL